MMTLFTAMLIGIVLAGYLTLVRHQEVAVTRSQGWNAALTMAEAGVEEALAQLNSGAASFSSDLSANGWGPPAGGSFNLQSRALTGGRYDVRYFTNSLSPTPTIYSTGYVTLPAMSATVARQVKVSTKTVPLINVAVAARYGITMSSGSLSADSYNSAVEQDRATGIRLLFERQSRTGASCAGTMSADRAWSYTGARRSRLRKIRRTKTAATRAAKVCAKI